MNNITYAVSVDVNNPIIPYNVYVASVVDSNVRYLEVTLYENGNVIALSNEATATASLVTDNVLVDDSVECTISNNIITVPLEDLQRHGNLDVQVTVTEGEKVLAIPFPIQVRVTPNIAEEAQIDENSMGSYAEVVQEIAEARKGHDSLDERLNSDASGMEAVMYKAQSIGSQSQTGDNVKYPSVTAVRDYVNIKTDDLQDYIENELDVLGEAKADKADTNAQFERLIAVLQSKAPLSTAYTFDDTTANVVYNVNNPKTIYLNATVDGEVGIVITAKNNGFQYFLGRRGALKIRYFTGDTSYSDWEQVTEHAGNKKNSITSSNRTSTDFYPSIKAVVDYLAANYLGSGDNTVSWANLAAAVQTVINGKESASNKLSSEAGIDEDSTDNEYPSAKAVYDYGTTITNNIEDVKAYIGYTDGDILGLHADFENNQFTRLGAAVGLSAGSDFNAFPMYGQRRRVVVESDGTITQAPPERITSDNISYDIMVYQPKFYYKVVPLKLEKQSSGLGYHIRKANYYISSTPHAGFKLHPLFFDKNGNEIEYVLFSAYEASYLYPTEGGFDYFHDGAGSDTGTSLDLEYGVLKSMLNVKPISGQYKAFNKTNAEILAQNKSSNWHLDTIQSVSANQLLIAIEYGTFNTQSAIGLGIVSNPNSDSNNCSSLTGSTSAETFNTASGMASETIYDVAGTETPFNTNGKVAVSYRGMENPWGNIWKHVNGINIWGDGTMNSGQLFICDDFSFNESKHDGNYQSAGFTISNDNGYVSAFGYGDEDYDWLFMPSETTGNSSLPVGDNFWCTSNLNGYRIARLGGAWDNGGSVGGFFWSCNSTPGSRHYAIGGRLLYVPTTTV